MAEGPLTRAEPLRDSVAAVSCGIYRGTGARPRLSRDVEAETDANFVLTGAGRYVEIRGTAVNRRRSPAPNSTRSWALPKGRRRANYRHPEGGAGVMITDAGKLLIQGVPMAMACLA